MASKATYPQRQQFFANRFIRLLGKTCVAQEIGCNGFALLVTIVMTEDASRYRRAVTFYDGQLMPILGMDSQKTLATTRRKAVEAGWLQYQHGSRGKPGRYWVLIPEHAEQIEDTPIDEGTCDKQDANEMPQEYHVIFTEKRESNRSRIGRESVENRSRIGDPSIPNPIPIPNTKTGAVDSEQNNESESTNKKRKPPTSTGLAKQPVEIQIPERLDTSQFRHAWDEWAAHRKDIRKPMTDRSRAMALKSLAAIGAERATAAIYHSIANGWQGIYEPKELGNGHSRTGIPPGGAISRDEERLNRSLQACAEFASEG